MNTAFDSLTAVQVEALANVAFGGHGGGLNWRTIRVLVNRGLIEPYTEVLGGRFPVTITKYAMPPAVHMDFCAWCAEHYPDPPEVA